MRVLVAGGAGYIGSFVVKALHEHGHDVAVFDSLEAGHHDAVDCPIIQGNLLDADCTCRVVRDGGYEAVVHLAAYISVRESVADPGRYFRNNAVGALNLLDACVAGDVSYLVFSSTSEVYGDARYLPLDEQHSTDPVNPYGLSKRMVEQFLERYDRAYGLRSISLRYFNAAGAALDGSMGEDHRPEEHLIPNAIRGALGLQEFRLTSAPVDTPDGTTIRDYVHVLDLAKAHVQALDCLAEGHPTDAINIGTSRGYSTREVIEMVQKLTGATFEVVPGDTRAGEPAEKYGSFEKAERVLGWRPEHGLESIIQSAVRWHSSHPNGYPD